MTFQWHGGDTIHIGVKRKEGSDVALITDPVGPYSPKSLSRSIKADIAVASFNQSDKELADVPSPDPERPPLVVTSPGEYERESFFITGIEGMGEAKHRTTLYRFDVEDLSIGYVAGASAMLSEAHLALLEGVHVLVVPVGSTEDGGGLELKIALEIIQEIDPSVVIGIRTRSSDAPKRSGIEAMAKLIGVEAQVVSGTYKLTKSDILEDQSLVLVGFQE